MTNGVTSPELIDHLETLLASEAGDSLGRLIRELVHDLRQPLCGALLVSDLLLGRQDIPADARAWISRVKDQNQAVIGVCREMANMVDGPR